MSVVQELFDRWALVFGAHLGAPLFICRDQQSIWHELRGGPIETPDGEMRETANVDHLPPDARCVVHERSVTEEREWQRVSLEWVDAMRGETRAAVGLRLLRFHAGIAVEAWRMLTPVNVEKASAIAPGEYPGRPSNEKRTYERPARERDSHVDCSHAEAQL